MLVSPYSIQLFLTCPAKFWYHIRKYKPIYIYDERMEFGRDLHSILACYYKLIPSVLTKDEIFIYIQKAVANALRLSFDFVEKRYGWQLKNFEKFEKQRLDWHVNPKPLAVEKEFKRPPFKGVVDALFEKNDSRVVIDWKSGYLPTTLSDIYLIQGCIYGLLTNANEVIFYFLSSGKFKKIEFTDCRRIKIKLFDVLNQIKHEISNKVRGEHCENCEYQLACYHERIKNILEEVG